MKSKIQNPKSKIVVVLILALGSLFAASSAQAHPAPSVLHDYVLSMAERAVQIESYLRVSPELVPEVFRQIDKDGDGSVSEAERQAWIAEHPSKLSATLDGNPLTFQMGQAPDLSRESLLASIDHPLKLVYTAALDAPVSGKHRIRLTYGDNYLSYDEYYLSVAGDVVNDNKPISLSQGKYPATYQVVYIMPTAEQANNVPPGILAPAPFTQGLLTPTPAANTSGSTTDANPQVAPIANSGQSGGPFGWATALRDTVQGMVENWRGEPGSALALLLLAMLLGGLHALTPGHGKAMVAAYLVGSRGRVRDAALLGGVVTATHTISVFALGFLIAFLSSFILPRALQPAVELISGAMVVGLGIYLVIARIHELRTRTRPRYVHTANGHSQIHAPTQSNGKEARSLVPVGAATGAQGTSSLPSRRVTETATVEANGHSHSHNGNGNGNGNGHSHDNSHNLQGDHHYVYGHSHGGKYHTHVNPYAARPLGKRALVGMGIAGGMVPCTDAIALLLLPGIGLIWLGMSLVAAFSLGLAGVLIAIGVVLVKMKGKLDTRLSANAIWTYWLPIVSAVIVIAMGLFIIFSALSTHWI
jgi:ABC-type nickel/cobalt efflux system permease component RcnA